MLDSSDNALPRSKQAKRRKRKAHPVSRTRGWLARRLGELHHLACFRWDHRVPFGDPNAWAFLLAELCLYLRNDRDLPTFQQLAESVLRETEFVVDDEAALAALHRVECLAGRRGGMYRPTGTVAAGKRLDLTTEECLFCDIRTMRPVDETDAEREARRREQNRERKRKARRTASKADKAKERKRAQRRRAAKNARPHAESFSRKQPWLLEGIGRTKWYARQRTETSTPMSRTETSGTLVLTSLCQKRPDESVRPSSRRHGNGKRNSKHGLRRREYGLPKEGAPALPLATGVHHLTAVGIG